MSGTEGKVGSQKNAAKPREWHDEMAVYYQVDRPAVKENGRRSWGEGGGQHLG